MLRNTEYKTIGQSLKALDEKTIQNQLILEQTFTKELESIEAALLLEPTNKILQKRREDHQKHYSEQQADILKQANEELEIIKNKLFELTSTSIDKENHNKFREKLKKTLSELDQTLHESAAALNKSDDGSVNVLKEHKKMDVLIFNTINSLSNSDSISNIDKLKLELTITLAPLTLYDVEKARDIANYAITHIIIQTIIKKHNLSFETITNSLIEKYFPSEKDIFRNLYFAIKEGWQAFSDNKTYLYTNLYNAKLIEYESTLRVDLIEKLIDQDNARMLLQHEGIKHLMEHKDPKAFYLQIVNLAIKEKEAKCNDIREKSKSHMEEFKVHKNEVLTNLKNELDSIYVGFFRKKELTTPAISMLNHYEVKKSYFLAATSGVQQTNYPSYFYQLTSQEVLQALDMEYQDTPLKITPKKEKERDQPASKFDSTKIEKFKNMIKKNQIHSFELLVKVEKNTELLQQLKKEIPSTSLNQPYLQAIEARLKNTHAFFQSAPSVALPDERHLHIQTKQKVL